jgi:hypothetical protein
MATVIINKLIPADTLTFDNIVFLRISPRITVTEHPVEFGVDVSDHAQRRALTIDIRGRITATPLLLPAPAAIELAQAFFERVEGQLVNFTTSRGVFSDMMITRYDSGNTGLNEAIFDVSAKNIRIAFAVSVPIPPRTPAPPLQAGAATGADAGVQPPIPTPPPDVSLVQTFAALF